VDAALELADWRRRVAELYLAAPREGHEGVDAFRRGRDELFRSHPQSPVAGHDGFDGLAYFDYDPGARVAAEIEPPAGSDPLELDTGGEDGVVTLRRAARLRSPLGELTLFWIEGYGGGLFLPFRDGTAGAATYGGGRYLVDTIKGTHGRGLELDPAKGRAVLDFNYAYNPSCAYDPSWACPLAPPENRLEEPVRAGERTYDGLLNES
jgi:uncharacterized protein